MKARPSNRLRYAGAGLATAEKHSAFKSVSDLPASASIACSPPVVRLS
jgi:hypothetical protein